MAYLLVKKNDESFYSHTRNRRLNSYSHTIDWQNKRIKNILLRLLSKQIDVVERAREKNCSAEGDSGTVLSAEQLSERQRDSIPNWKTKMAKKWKFKLSYLQCIFLPPCTTHTNKYAYQSNMCVSIYIIAAYFKRKHDEIINIVQLTRQQNVENSMGSDERRSRQ